MDYSILILGKENFHMNFVTRLVKRIPLRVLWTRVVIIAPFLQILGLIIVICRWYEHERIAAVVLMLSGIIGTIGSWNNVKKYQNHRLDDILQPTYVLAAACGAGITVVGLIYTFF